MSQPAQPATTTCTAVIAFTGTAPITCDTEHDGPRCPHQRAHLTGLRCSVFRAADMPDCSNGGVSGRYSKVTLIGPTVNGPFEPADDAPAVFLVPSHIPRFTAEPHAQPVDGHPGRPMFGGAYVATSDSRFGEATGGWRIVALHDRWER